MGESDFDLDALRMEQLNIIGMRLRTDYSTSEEEEIRTSPIVSVAAKKSMDRRGSNTKSLLPQYGLLAGRIDLSKGDFALSSKTPKEQEALDPRLFLNVNAPWSAFICGSQGSGKSHSMCCILENCLLSHPAINLLPSPLAGLVFHYDSFTSDVAGQVCEAAYLCSSGIDITVLVSPSNLPHMVELYENLPGLPVSASKPKVEPLLLDQKYLNAERLMTLMAAGNSDGAVPLYMQTVLQTLRDMAREPKRLPGIDYGAFKSRVLARPLTPSQLGPLELRLDLLESFLALPKSNVKRMKTKGNSWTPAGGKLVIVDLSCPFVDADTACALFGICLGIFLEQRMDIGRIIALDEAHKVYSLGLPLLHFPLIFECLVYEKFCCSEQIDRLSYKRCSASKTSSVPGRNRYSRAHCVSTTYRPLFHDFGPSFRLSALARCPQRPSGGYKTCEGRG